MDRPDPIRFEVYFDYLCPYVYRAALLIEEVRRSGRELDIRWRYFSLTQVNSKDDGWAVWAAPAAEPVRGRLAFAAAEAARRQDRFDRFHRALLEARHRDRADLDVVEVVESVAASSGLDVARLRQDIADPAILDTLAADHRHAVHDLGVFGTPTFVFEDGCAAYVRLAPPEAGDGALEVFERLLAVAALEPRILEIKRPRKPIS